MASDYHFRKKPGSESVPTLTSELRMTTAKDGRKYIAKSLSVKGCFFRFPEPLFGTARTTAARLHASMPPRVLGPELFYSHVSLVLPAQQFEPCYHQVGPRSSWAGEHEIPPSYPKI